MTDEYPKPNNLGDLSTEDKEMSREEFIISHSGPAILSNRFFISHGHWGVRVAFAEQLRIDIPPEFRTAVVMSNQDAIDLYKSLHHILNESTGKIKLISVRRTADNNKDEEDDPNET